MAKRQFNAQAIQNQLRNVKISTTKKNPYVLHFAEQGSLAMVSAEHGDGAADYYGEFFGGGYPYIDPALEKFAEKHDAFWEWVNPGQIALYRGYN